MISTKTAIGAVCVMLMMSATAASAETMVRIRNDSELPANITVDKKSRDVRPRKAASFPIVNGVGVLKVAFANGDVNKAEFSAVGETLPVENAPDGNTYYCMTLDTDDFEFLTQAQCAEWVAKLGK